MIKWIFWVFHCHYFHPRIGIPNNNVDARDQSAARESWLSQEAILCRVNREPMKTCILSLFVIPHHKHPRFHKQWQVALRKHLPIASVSEGSAPPDGSFLHRLDGNAWEGLRNRCSEVFKILFRNAALILLDVVPLLGYILGYTLGYPLVVKNWLWKANRKMLVGKFPLWKIVPVMTPFRKAIEVTSPLRLLRWSSSISIIIFIIINVLKVIEGKGC